MQNRKAMIDCENSKRKTNDAFYEEFRRGAIQFNNDGIAEMPAFLQMDETVKNVAYKRLFAISTPYTNFYLRIKYAIRNKSQTLSVPDIELKKEWQEFTDLCLKARKVFPLPVILKNQLFSDLTNKNLRQEWYIDSETQCLERSNNKKNKKRSLPAQSSTQNKRNRLSEEKSELVASQPDAAPLPSTSSTTSSSSSILHSLSTPSSSAHTNSLEYGSNPGLSEIKNSTCGIVPPDVNYNALVWLLFFPSQDFSSSLSLESQPDITPLPATPYTSSSSSILHSLNTSSASSLEHDYDLFNPPEIKNLPDVSSSMQNSYTSVLHSPALTPLPSLPFNGHQSAFFTETKVPSLNIDNTSETMLKLSNEIHVDYIELTLQITNSLAWGDWKKDGLAEFCQREILSERQIITIALLKTVITEKLHFVKGDNSAISPEVLSYIHGRLESTVKRNIEPQKRSFNYSI